MSGVEMGTVPKEPRLGVNPQILSLPRDELLPVAHEAGGTGVDEVMERGRGASRRGWSF